MNYINQIVKRISDQINGKYRTHADALSAVNADPQSLRYVSKHLRNNREIVMAAVNGRISIPLGISILKYASDDLRNDPKVVLAAVKKDPFELRYASSELRNDRDLVSKAVRAHGSALWFASSELRNDRDLVLKAIQDLRIRGYFSEFDRWVYITFAIGKNIKNQRDFIIDMLEIDELFLKYLYHEFKNDRTIILQQMAKKCDRLYYTDELYKNFDALKYERSYYYTDELYKNFDAFQYASKQLKHDRSFIIEAIKLDGLCIKHLSHEFKNDRTIVLHAIAQNSDAFQYASKQLKHDRSFIIEAIRLDGFILVLLSEALKNDFEIVMAAVNQNGLVLACVSDELKNNRDVVMTAARQDGLAIRFTESNELGSDPELLIAGLESNPVLLEHLTPEGQNESSYVMAAVKKNGMMLAYAGPDQQSNFDIVAAAVNQNGNALQHASEALRDHFHIVGWAIMQNVMSLQYASNRCKDHREIIKLAISQDARAAAYIGRYLAEDEVFLRDLFKIDVNVATYLPIENKTKYTWLNQVSNIHQLRQHDRILTEQSSTSSELALNAESEYIMPKLMGSYNQLCKMIYFNMYDNLADCHKLNAIIPWQFHLESGVIEYMLEFLSYTDLVNLQFLATNRYVEDKNDQEEVIKRLPKLENEWEDTKGDKFASITKADRQLGIQTFFRASVLNGPTKLCNHARHRQ